MAFTGQYTLLEVMKKFFNMAGIVSAISSVISR